MCSDMRPIGVACWCAGGKREVPEFVVSRDNRGIERKTDGQREFRRRQEACDENPFG